MKKLINNFTGTTPSGFPDLHKRKNEKTETTKEGVIVNTFIKDPETYGADFPVRNTPLPKDMFEKKEKISGEWYNNPIVPLITVPLLVLGVGAGLSLAYKKSFLNKYKTPENIRIPRQGRLIALNNDDLMSLLMFVQNPSFKNLQVATAVIAASSTAFIMKNVVDGFKEVLVKKQVADIKRDKEEQLIDIETRSFSGKNQIIRSLISQKAAELETYEKMTQKPEINNLISFTNYKKKISFNAAPTEENNLKPKEKDSSKKIILYTFGGVAALALTALFTKSIFKNLASITKKISEKAAEATEKLKIDLNTLSAEEFETELEKAQISDGAKDFARSEWDKIHSPSGFAPTPEYQSGTLDKTGFTSVVLAQASSFIYTWLINKTPQSQTLATVMCSAMAIGYLGESAVKAVKEVQVEKANANTEINLQDRLVQVELNNFYQKKNSYIQPLMDDYKEKIKNPITKESVKKLKENILTEIKSGPPFVYS